MKSDSDRLESVKAIYKYIYDTFIEGRATDDERQQVKERFQHRKCLWDESTSKFWKPIDAFQDDVPFFGSRRVTIPFSHRTGEVYQLLGQKRSPGVQDYLNFLQELAEEYSSKPLREEDKNYAIQVIQRLESHLSLEGGSAINIPLLTDNNQLCPANKIFIADAPWRKDYIERNRILHPLVSVKLAKLAGSLSLLRDVIERPTDVNTALHTQGNQWCEEWQRTLNSQELQTGVKRLIFHEHDAEPVIDIIWLTTAKVLPASQINVDLFLKDETRLASAIPGTYYFDDFKRIFYIISSGSRYIMLCYLAESLNNQMGEYRIQNLLPLASIIDAEPRKIRGLLNELRIRSLPGDEREGILLNLPEISFDSSDWDTWGEQLAICFYRFMGYTSIVKNEDTDGYYLDCTGLELPEIQAKVKLIDYKCPQVYIKSTDWSRMIQLGQKYELLIVSYQGKTVDNIIQINDIWNTLRYAEVQLKNRVPNSDTSPTKNDEVLIEFSNSAEHPNDLILNWHRLVESFHSEKIRKYCPVPSMLSYGDEPAEFKLI
ncbi:MAG TPA: hypothetical protein V6D12_22465 [Candidatus Obscuribacterales bacterium]